MADDKKEKDELQEKVEVAQQEDSEQQEEQQINETEQLKEQLARCMADMQNMKRRAEEDKMRFVKFANAELLKAILPVVDNFDRACQQVPENLKEDGWATGVIKTHDELMKALEKMGVARIATVGEKLDPTKHEAVLQGEGEQDVITEEFEPGYSYNGETLKAAKVKVGNGS
ncbi:nucleotide exchange factor GrpE [Candidatus Pacearchaeota archaeon]|nr:nucleotide exchange factor GrpE [Candidatus Pacearchaeota archaeon]